MKTYTITWAEYENGTMLNRTNDGFNCFELYGLLTQATKEVEAIILKTEDKPDITTRTVVRHKDKDCTQLIEAAKDFINKVDTGKAKSKDSYQKFTEALKLIQS